jgi:branched-subunit amino acid ABC-type transport system permease component
MRIQPRDQSDNMEVAIEALVVLTLLMTRSITGIRIRASFGDHYVLSW